MCGRARNIVIISIRRESAPPAAHTFSGECARSENRPLRLRARILSRGYFCRWPRTNERDLVILCANISLKGPILPVGLHKRAEVYVGSKNLTPKTRNDATTRKIPAGNSKSHSRRPLTSPRGGVGEGERRICGGLPPRIPRECKTRQLRLPRGVFLFIFIFFKITSSWQRLLVAHSAEFNTDRRPYWIANLIKRFSVSQRDRQTIDICCITVLVQRAIIARIFVTNVTGLSVCDSHSTSISYNVLRSTRKVLIYWQYFTDYRFTSDTTRAVRTSDTWDLSVDENSVAGQPHFFFYHQRRQTNTFHHITLNLTLTICAEKNTCSIKVNVVRF